MTHRRHIRFDPPIAEPLNDGLVLLVGGARRGTRGFSAALQLWNDHVIYADDIVIDHARQRDRFIGEALAQHPALDQSVLAQALLKLVAALPPLIDASPSSHATSPPLPSADAQAAEESPMVLPTIEAKEGDLRVVTDQAWAAIQQANTPTPQVFRYGGGMVRLERDDDGQVFPVELTADRIRHMLARIARWVVSAEDDEGERVERIVRPPADVPRDILATPDPPLPILRRIVEVPVFALDGTLQTTPGYHEGSRTYFSPPPDFTLPPVSDDPSPAELQQATQLILNEVMQDFPFVADADRAHAVSLFLQPFCRDLISGPMPLYVIEAPIEGSGKGLLAEVCLTPAMGRRVGTLAPGRDEEEWRKSITSVLREGHEALWIDNLVHPLDSGTLAAALTTGVWEDRILGQSRTIRVPVRCAWLATANNPVLSRELTRRSIRIRIDPKVDRPWLRQAFHHDDLHAWVHAHRADLVWAALTMVRAWLAAGRPQPSIRSLGSYEAWSRVIGGMLTTAGIPGFLGNLNEFYEAANTESAAWRSLVAVWWHTYQDTPVTTAELLPLAREFEELEIGGKDEGGQRRSLGKKLAVQRDRVIGRYQIVAAGEHANALRWKLVRAPDPSGENSPNSPDSPDSHGDSEQTSANSPNEKVISSNTYLVPGEFGEFHPAAPESPEEKSSRVVTTEPSEPAAQPLGVVHASTDVEHHIQLEMPMDHVMTPFVEAQPEAWKRDHLVCRYDRQRGYVVGFTAAALDTLVEYVATCSGFGSGTERDHYAATLTWLIDHH